MSARSSRASGAAGRAPIHDSRPDTSRFTIHGLTPSCATRGGVRLSVAGTLAPGAMGEWRKGREVRVAASLREPTTYRNPGVPDEQRALARRGIALVGSVKSAAMVEVTAPGSRRDEWASAFRAWVRSVLVGHGRALERALGRRRRRDRDRRSHGAGAGRRGTAAGGGDVSRHRDLGREHRDSDPAPPRRRALAGRVATNRRRRRDRRAAGLRPGHRAGALGRSRDLGGGPLSRRTAHRTAWALDQHPGRGRDRSGCRRRQWRCSTPASSCRLARRWAS